MHYVARRLWLVLIIGLGCLPGKAGEVVHPDVLVHLTQVQPTHRLVEVSRVELAYGDSPDAIGFEPGGNERQAIGPSAFEVDRQGDYLVADPVHHQRVRVSLVTGNPVVSGAGALSFRPSVNADDGVREVRVTKCNAEAGLISLGPAGRKIQVEIGAALASIRLIGVNSGGDIYLVVEQFKERRKLAVDRLVLVLDSTGELKARMPVLDRPAVHPDRDFMLGPDDVLHRMVPGTQAVRFIRWEVRP